MKSKLWGLYLFVGICFLFIGIMNLISQKYFLGIIYIIFGSSYFVTNVTRKSTKIQVSDEVLSNLNIDLRKLISEGKKIKAIKKYRVVTGSGLKEAKEYIDNLK